ncbi:MAG: ABC transporter ATP-binding protein [Deltaproteobacteria bacterium]|nr:ABC transporter ATP-binding protein [Deltaproteobacteria bacterium]MBW2122772.1 ABC transporter ATP-binding protein [Deltaproteobacteria bacterium]
MTADLILDDVHTYYGVSHVLHGVSLQVGRGRFACLLGRNGMGKTTTLRSIMGLTPASRGSITYRGERIEGLRPYEIYALGIGYVPQGRRMFPYLTVHENLRMGLRDKRQKNPVIFDKLFELFPVLAERRRQKAGTLSGGEQQMLAIARALAGEAGMLLLDEPTEGVQPNIVDEILQLLARINESEGLTILLVEQNIEMALGVAQDYYVMEKGVVVEGGAVSQMDREAVVERYLVV